MNYLKSNFLSLIILIAMVGVSFYLYPDLPDQIPSSFDLDGTVQDYSSKNLMVVLLPLIYAILLVVINLLIRVSPQKFSMPNSKQAMDIIMFGIGVYFLFIHLDLLNRNQDSSETGFYISLGAGLFLIIVGNVFGKTERNFFIGLRTPWTLASTDNWRVTHRLAGKLCVIVGVLILVVNSFLNSMLIIVALAVSVIIIPVIYSLVYYLKYEKPNEANEQED